MGATRDEAHLDGRATLGARLQGARRRAFVGREAELDRFRAALAEDVPPFAVLVVHGPGGVGKSALLAQFEQLAIEAGRAPLRLDGRSVEPTPQGVVAALGEALGVVAEDAVATLAGRPGAVLLVDTHELLAPLDGWLRHTLLPQLREDVLVVLAGRQPPEAGWRSDPGWQDLVEDVALRDLPPEDAGALLAARGVPADRHAEALAVGRGHPLALVLLGEVLPQVPAGSPFSLADAPDVIHVLLRRFVADVPSAAHRDALLACAHATVATEALLREAVDHDDHAALFRWLRDLPFSELGPDGVALHDLVAEVLDAEARWRDPDHYARVHHVVSRHVGARVGQTSGRARQRALRQLIALHRFNPVARQFYDFDADPDVWVEPAEPDDHDAIVAMTATHEGAASADLARWWLQHQPEAFHVFRTGHERRPTGYVAHLRLGDTPGEEVAADPVLAVVWQYVRRTAPLRPDEQVLVLRFWVDERTHQDVATHHLVSTTAAQDWVTTPRLAWTVTVLRDTDFWEPIFAFIDFHRVPDGEVSVGDHHVGMFARDWRTTSVGAWLQLVSERQVSPAAIPHELPAGREQLLVLSADDFGRAVRDALRGLARPDGLADSPLLRSRVVVEHAGDGRPREAALEQLLHEAVGALADHPRDDRRRRALELAYLTPAPTQEAAAERLGLPYSTFRRHLTEGVDAVITWLWERELHGRPAARA